MILNNLGIIFGDTVRSKAYLHSMLKHDLLPSEFIFMDNPYDKSLAGQFEFKKSRSEIEDNFMRSYSDSIDDWSEASFDPGKPIKHTLGGLGVSYKTIALQDINEKEMIDLIKGSISQNFIFSGYGGNLLRKEVLATGKNFLHIHGGFLPHYKGSTCNYYSMLVNSSFGASAILLNEKIDSGPILYRKSFQNIPDKKLIDEIYDPAARAKVLVHVLKEFSRNSEWNSSLEINSGDTNYYVIHPVLKHLAIMSD